MKFADLAVEHEFEEEPHLTFRNGEVEVPIPAETCPCAFCHTMDRTESFVTVLENEEYTPRIVLAFCSEEHRLAWEAKKTIEPSLRFARLLYEQRQDKGAEHGHWRWRVQHSAAAVRPVVRVHECEDCDGTGEQEDDGGNQINCVTCDGYGAFDHP